MRNLTLIVTLVFCFSFLSAQSNGLDDVHLFQTFFQDAPITKTAFGEGGIVYDSYDGFSQFSLGIQGAYPINQKIEVGAGIGFLNWSFDKGDGQSGLKDLWASGKYNILSGATNISAGGYVTLPIGEEKVGQGNFNLGAFGAVRHTLNSNLVITGVLGLDFMEMTKTEWNAQTFKFEEETEYETSVLIAGGAIYSLNENVNLIGELNLKTKGDYVMLSAGGDYKLPMGSRVRGALGLGLDDGAPDLSLLAGFLHFF